MSSSSDTDCTTFDVEEILAHRTGPRGKSEYLVKWQGFSSENNSWEPKANFVSLQMISDFHAEEKKKKEDRRKAVILGQCETYVKAKHMSGISFVPQEVENIRQNEDGDLVALVRFSDEPTPIYMPVVWANIHCTQLIIKFYESRIYWQINQERLEKFNMKSDKAKQ